MYISILEEGKVRKNEDFDDTLNFKWLDVLDLGEEPSV